MKIAAYIRTATAENDGAIECQKKTIEDYIKKNPGFEIQDYYVDEGVCGNLPFDKRTAGRKLLDSAKAGEFKTVIVSRPDRIGRNLKDVLRTVRIFNCLNVGIKSLSDFLDTTTVEGSLMFNIFSSICEYERKMLSEKIKQGIRNKRNVNKVAVKKSQ